MSKFKIDFRWKDEENKIGVEKIYSVEFNSKQELVIYGENSEGETVEFTRDTDQMEELSINNISGGE